MEEVSSSIIFAVDIPCSRKRMDLKLLDCVLLEREMMLKFYGGVTEKNGNLLAISVG